MVLIILGVLAASTITMLSLVAASALVDDLTPDEPTHYRVDGPDGHTTTTRPADD